MMPPGVGPDAVFLSVLAADLRRDEGVKRAAYQDSLGFWTIGVGRLIDARRGGGLSDDEIDYLLMNDIRRAYVAAQTFSWFDGLDSVRQRAVVEMVFNLGLTRFRRFTHALAALAAGDYLAAADHLHDSLWFQQVGARAVRLVAMIRTGQPA